MNLYRKLFTVLLLSLMVTGLTSAAFYQISFRGLQLDKTNVDAGESIGFATNIVNLGEDPRTDIKVEALLVRESDKSVVYEEVVRSDVDLAAREAILVNKSVTVPDNVPEANYTFMLRAVDASGIVKSFVSQDISVDNDRSITSVGFGNKGVYLLAKRIITGDGYTKTYSLPSYGTQGENVLPGSNFTLKFNLENKGTETVSPEAKFRIVPTYSSESDAVKTFTRDLESISPQETNEYSFESELKTPGTYEVKVEIVDSEGNFLSSSQVRLVIAGAGGSITDVANSQDTYSAGQTVSASATVVGPADGSTVVRDAYLKMVVTKDGNQVLSTSKTIDTLPLSPKEYKLEAQTSQTLTNYTMKISLGKGDKVFDTYTARYEPLTAERKLMPSGQVKEVNACFDNGKCTKNEFEMGSCYDCIGVNKTKFVSNKDNKDGQNNKSSSSFSPIYIALVVLLLAVLGGLGYKYWR
ncbi:MAG: hypothetical protein ABEK04_00435 [Candidatus Nanohalobium sp.]